MESTIQTILKNLSPKVAEALSRQLIPTTVGANQGDTFGPSTRPEVVGCVRSLFLGTELNAVKKRPDRLTAGVFASGVYGQQGIKAVVMQDRKGYGHC